MTFILDKLNLYSIFNVNSFEELKLSIDKMAPSMTEYYLDDIATVSSNLYLNKTDVQNTIFLDNHYLYLDYNDDLYLEICQKDNEYESATLW